MLKDLGNKKYEIKTICRNGKQETIVEGTAIILQ